jgi:hypothetical protein
MRTLSHDFGRVHGRVADFLELDRVRNRLSLSSWMRPLAAINLLMYSTNTSLLIIIRGDYHCDKGSAREMSNHGNSDKVQEYTTSFSKVT